MISSLTSFSSGFLFLLAPLTLTLCCCYPQPFSAVSLWRGTFRQTEAVVKMMFEQCLLLDGPSFIFTHGAFPVPEQLYTWLHLELKERTESLSPAKEQQHCDFYWDACFLRPCLHSQLTKRGYYFCSNQMTSIQTSKVNIDLNWHFAIFAKTLHWKLR